MGFVLFLILNAILFMRPDDLAPELAGLRLYYCAITACLIVSAPALVGRILPASLRHDPITACVCFMWVAVGLSHLRHGRLQEAIDSMTEFGKVVIYYLLVLTHVNSGRRLMQFLLFTLACATILVGLSVLDFHDFIQLPTLQHVVETHTDSSSGELTPILRMRSLGVFNDPNDLCLAILIAASIAAYFAWSNPLSMAFWLWLSLIGFLAYAVMATQSRGGMLGLLAALSSFVILRFGWKRGFVLAVLCVPLAASVFTDRQTDLAINKSSTSNSRLELWCEGLARLKVYPTFGIGAGQYADECAQVAHNSYVEAFVELGFVGGIPFAGAFLLATRLLMQRPSDRTAPELTRLRPFLFALLMGYMTGMLSLSREYVIPTFLVLGTVNAYLHLTMADATRDRGQLGYRMLLWLVVSATTLLLMTKLFAQTFVQFG